MTLVYETVCGNCGKSTTFSCSPGTQIVGNHITCHHCLGRFSIVSAKEIPTQPPSAWERDS
jgi:hypothetical protein